MPLPLILMGASLAMTAYGMKKNQDMADRNSDIEQMSGEAKERALLKQSRSLGKSQRALKAQAQVNIAASGGNLTEEQPLIMMQEQAGDMQVDLLEMQRKGRLSRQEGNQRSMLAKMGGQQQSIQGASQMVGTVGNYLQARR